MGCTRRECRSESGKQPQHDDDFGRAFDANAYLLLVHHKIALADLFDDVGENGLLICTVALWPAASASMIWSQTPVRRQSARSQPNKSMSHVPQRDIQINLGRIDPPFRWCLIYGTNAGKV